jgi:hypothetical protein
VRGGFDLPVNVFVPDGGADEGNRVRVGGHTMRLRQQKTALVSSVGFTAKRRGNCFTSALRKIRSSAEDGNTPDLHQGPGDYAGIPEGNSRGISLNLHDFRLSDSARGTNPPPSQEITKSTG